MSSTQASTPNNGVVRLRPSFKVRRKDLQFDDTVVVAVAEDGETGRQPHAGTNGDAEMTSSQLTIATGDSNNEVFVDELENKDVV
jgi:hypothetical protein